MNYGVTRVELLEKHRSKGQGLVTHGTTLPTPSPTMPRGIQFCEKHLAAVIALGKFHNSHLMAFGEKGHTSQPNAPLLWSQVDHETKPMRDHFSQLLISEYSEGSPGLICITD